MAVYADYLNKDKEDDKSYFITREGVYRLISQTSNHSRTRNSIPSNPIMCNTPVHVSFMPCESKPKLCNNKLEKQILIKEEKMCYNYGKELYVYSLSSRILNLKHMVPIDKRFYKCTFPTCHDFNTNKFRLHSVLLLVGFTGGQIQMIDPIQKDQSKLFNEERIIDGSPVTCIQWVPDSPNLFLVSHASGQLYLYNQDLPSGASPPHYHLHKAGPGYSVHACKTRTPRNPIYRWLFHPADDYHAGPTSANAASGRSGGFKTSRKTGKTPDSTTPGSHDEVGRSRDGVDAAVDTSDHLDGINVGSTTFHGAWSEGKGREGKKSGSKGNGNEGVVINQFAFSPCARYLAIVTQDGYLRVFYYKSMELQGSMRSYFGGLLCLSWSPDGRFLALGGEDDLVTIWAVHERVVVVRGQGHRSWVNVVRFDPLLCPPPIPQESTHNTEVTTNCTNDVSDEICAHHEEDELCSIGSKIVQHTGSTLQHNSELGGVHPAGPSISRQSPADSLGVPLNHHPHLHQDNGSSVGARSTHRRKCLTSYRLGSVGQDTLFCIWEFTEDEIRQGLRFAASNSSSSGAHSSNPSPAPTNHPHSSHQPSSTLTSSAKDKMEAKLPSESGNPSNRTLKFRISRGRLFRRKSSTFKDLEDKGSADSSTTDRRTQPADDSKKINNAEGGLVNGVELPEQTHIAKSRLLGTSICPRLEDVPILQALVCKRVSQDRLTELLYRPDSIVVASQQGSIYTWARPPSTTAATSTTSVNTTADVALGDVLVGPRPSTSASRHPADDLPGPSWLFSSSLPDPTVHLLSQDPPRTPAPSPAPPHLRQYQHQPPSPLTLPRADYDSLERSTSSQHESSLVNNTNRKTLGASRVMSDSVTSVSSSHGTGVINCVADTNSVSTFKQPQTHSHPQKTKLLSSGESRPAQPVAMSIS